MNILQPEQLPFIALKGITLNERGKLQEHHFIIAGVKVSFKLGDLREEQADAVIIPNSPRTASERSVAGHFVRSSYQKDIKKLAAVMKEQEEPIQYGDVIHTDIEQGDTQTDFGKPSFFFNAFTVTKADEPNLQFNAVRNSIRKAGWAAIGLSDDKRTITKIATPAIGTGPIGHLVGYQSARAIYSGIYDLGKEIEGSGKEVHFSIVIKKDSMHAPMIDEFLEVMQDLSYLDVPSEGEVGMKVVNQDRYLDHMLTEDALTKAYNLMQDYTKDYPRYDS